MNYLRKMQKRTKSGFDLSIGTGMALQAIFNTTHDVYDSNFMPSRIDINQYDIFMVNWYTIIRNVIQSFDKELKSLVFSTGKLKDDIIAIANMELETIQHLCDSAGIDFIVLAPDYKKLKSFIFNDTINQNTDMFHIAGTTLNRISVDYENDHNPSYGNVLLLSHTPFDLLITRSNVSILQSHTGTILGKYDKYKKYRKTTVDLSFLPYYSVLLFLLSDSTGLLKLINREARIDAIKTLQKSVTQKTTKHRVKHLLFKSKIAGDFVKQFKDPYN